MGAVFGVVGFAAIRKGSFPPEKRWFGTTVARLTISTKFDIVVYGSLILLWLGSPVTYNPTDIESTLNYSTDASRHLQMRAGSLIG
jgi:hypothetical protein